MSRRPVTLAEAQHLREAGHSAERGADDAVQAVMDANMWELEVNALMGEVSLQEGASLFRRAQRALFEVKAVLDALEEQTVTAEDVPLAGLPPCGWNKKAVQLRFAAPARVDVVGGFLLKSSPVRPRLTIDVAVEIPDACITPNDHLNYRYHDKRILYLGVLARALQRAGCDATALGGATPLLLSAAEGGVRVRGFGGSAACASASSKPILELRFDARFKCSALTVRIIPTISRVAIPAAKLSPTRCSVRRRHAVADAEAPEAATPHYSNSILEDTCMREHLQHLHSEGSGFDAFARAALLLKVWARQQDLDGASGVSGFFLSMVLLYLVREKKVSRQMRALQLFRVAIRFLVDWLPASIDFWAASQAAQRKAGRTLRPLAVRPAVGEDALVSSATLTALRNAFAVVLLGPVGVVNVAARLTPAAATELQHAAAVALAAMKTQPPMVAFTALFISAEQTACAPVTRTADAHFAIAVPRVPPAGISAALRDAAADLGWGEAWRRAVFRTLTCALGSSRRASRLVVRDATASAAWSPAEAPPGPTLRELANSLSGDAAGDATAGKIVVSCTFGDDAEQIVLRGPAADDKVAARAFREFWGSKSELRRFRDGGVVEAVVWSALREQPHLVSAAMARHALARHVGLNVEDDEALSSSLDCLRPTTSFEAQRGAFSHLLELFQSLVLDIKSLKGLPLSVRSISAACSALAGTAIETIEPHLFAGADRDSVRQAKQLSRIIPALDVVLKFETSARWPDDVAAIQSTKVAFCLRIAERLALEKKRHAVVTEGHIDIGVEGFVFRIHIACERERELLQRAATGTKPSGIKNISAYAAATPAMSSAAARAELDALEVAHVHRPALCNALQTIALRCPAFVPTARLAKRWLAAHMLASQIDEDAVDLLVARCFCGALTLTREEKRSTGGMKVQGSSGAPWAQPPRTAAAGLLCFLRLLGAWDFGNAPLVVPLGGVSISAAQSSVLMSRFQKEREVNSAPAMYLISLLSGEDRRGGSSGAPMASSVDTVHDAAAVRIDQSTSGREEVPPCIWTRARPGPVALARIAAYARTSAALLYGLMRSGADAASPGFEQLFQTNTSCFDVLIELHAFGDAESAEAAAGGAGPSASKRRRVMAAKKPKLSVPVHRNMLVGASGAGSSKLTHALVGLDPPRAYVRELERRFSDAAVIFAGAARTSGDGLWTTVGIVWRPPAFLPKPLALASCNGTLCLSRGKKESESSSLLTLPNIVEMMTDVARCGEGIVRHVNWAG